VISDSLTDAISEVKASQDFHDWKPSYAVRTVPSHIEKSNMMKEKHYSPDELASLWGVKRGLNPQNLPRRTRRLEDGRYESEAQRQYLTLRIPESVVERVYTRLSE
jgi:hypothetical protein